MHVHRYEARTPGRIVIYVQGASDECWQFIKTEEGETAFGPTWNSNSQSWLPL